EAAGTEELSSERFQLRKVHRPAERPPVPGKGKDKADPSTGSVSYSVDPVTGEVVWPEGVEVDRQGATETRNRFVAADSFYDPDEPLGELGVPIDPSKELPPTGFVEGRSVYNEALSTESVKVWDNPDGGRTVRYGVGPFEVDRRTGEPVADSGRLVSDGVDSFVADAGAVRVEVKRQPAADRRATSLESGREVPSPPEGVGSGESETPASAPDSSTPVPDGGSTPAGDGADISEGAGTAPDTGPGVVSGPAGDGALAEDTAPRTETPTPGPKQLEPERPVPGPPSGEPPELAAVVVSGDRFVTGFEGQKAVTVALTDNYGAVARERGGGQGPGGRGPGADRGRGPGQGAGGTGKKAVATGILDGVDAEVFASDRGVKFDLVVETADDAVGVVQVLTVPAGWSMRQGAGLVELLRPDGEVGGVWAGGPVYDSASTPGESFVGMELLGFADGVGRAELVVDEAWLRDPSRVYPVRVDPSVSVGTFGEAGVAEWGPDTNLSGAETVMVGYWSFSINRGYYKFEDPVYGSNRPAALSEAESFSLETAGG
ncbi:MAG: hypothetical protein AAGK32_10590, partial [Actinomycetota bacterium]